MKHFTFFLFVFCIGFLQAQNPLPILQPELGYLPDFSAKGLEKLKQMERRFIELNNKATPFSELSEEDQWIVQNFDDTKESPYEVIGAGCSWYCGGDSIGVSSSSFLSSNNKAYNYVPLNAHDLNFKTAWVEGVKGNGIGEYLEYRFDNTHPRVTEIIIHNGYVKTDKAWKENGRVKKMKMIMNGKPYALLDLKDTKAAQHFKFEPLGRRQDGRDLYIRFEIMEVYPGSKYEDVAISEIYFDGIDVHCLAGESLITLANNSAKQIQALQKGDEILIRQINTQKEDKFKVEQIYQVSHSSIVVLEFENGERLQITRDHPLYSCTEGWVAIDPIAANRYHHFSNINTLTPGDKILWRDPQEGKFKITSLKSFQIIEKSIDTYTLSGIPSGWGFIANGILVAGDTAVNH